MFDEQKYIIETFRENYETIKKRNMVIYGIGLNTKIILDEFTDYNILGLMDGSKDSGNIYGKSILSYDDVVKLKTEIIVVIARSSSAKIIFNRIKNFCLDNEIELLDINKNNLFELYNEDHIKVDNNKYFTISPDDLKKQILRHDVISFDIFDTLIMRKVLYPHYVFDIMEDRLKDSKVKITGFKKRRIEAERGLLTETNPTICEIYDVLQSKCNLTDDEKKTLISLEIATEKQVLIKRKHMVEIMNFAIEKGKKVYLVSDMYYPKSVLQEFLLSLGIDGYIDIFVSCDYRVSKSNGLFSVYKGKVKGKSYLHIGDNSDADGLYANLNGIDSFIIKSAADIMEISSYKNIVKQVNSYGTALFAGLFAAKAFNDPFALYKSDGHLTIKSVYDLGYLFVAPIISAFTFWLIHCIKEEHFDYILFSARDGYLIKKLYEIAANMLGIKNMPKGIYFLTSRMACTSSAIVNEEDIKYAVSSFPYDGKPEKMLQIRFGLMPNEILPFSEKEYSNLVDYAMEHKDIIINHSSKNREKYIKYIKSIEIKEKSKAAFFDFVSTGTCQLYVSKLFPWELTGFYFIHYFSESDEKNALPIRGMYEKGIDNNKNYIFENYFFLETIITSFSPSLLYFDENLNPVYQPETRSKEEMAFIRDTQSAITDYFSQNIHLFGGWAENNKIISEILFSLIDKKYTNISCDKIKSLSLFDDYCGRRIDFKDNM